MDLYTTDGTLLYSSRAVTLKRTLLEAVIGGVPLERVNLRRAKLRGLRLDGMKAAGACLWGADLSGCDLGGADLSGADARMATLADCCLAEANCAEARFDGAFFRQTIMTACDFSRCSFSCPSILNQPLTTCATLAGAVYWHRGEHACPLDDGITRLNTAEHTIVVLGRHLITNGDLWEPKNFSGMNTTKSSDFSPKNANCHAS